MLYLPSLNFHFLQYHKHLLDSNNISASSRSIWTKGEMDLEEKKLATAQMCETNTTCIRELECKRNGQGKTLKPFNFTQFPKLSEGKN